MMTRLVFAEKIEKFRVIYTFSVMENTEDEIKDCSLSISIENNIMPGNM